VSSNNQNQDYHTKPLVPWTMAQVDQGLGKWAVRIPMILTAVIALVTGTVYFFPSIPSALLINGVGGALGGAGRGAVDSVKPTLDAIEQGSRGATFGRQNQPAPDDRLQQGR